MAHLLRKLFARMTGRRRLAALEEFLVLVAALVVRALDRVKPPLDSL